MVNNTVLRGRYVEITKHDSAQCLLSPRLQRNSRYVRGADYPIQSLPSTPHTVSSFIRCGRTGSDGYKQDDTADSFAHQFNTV